MNVEVLFWKTEGKINLTEAGVEVAFLLLEVGSNSMNLTLHSYLLFSVRD